MLHKIFDKNLVTNKHTLQRVFGNCIKSIIKNNCDNKSQLLFTDTDGLMYEVKTEHVY